MESHFLSWEGSGMSRLASLGIRLQPSGNNVICGIKISHTLNSLVDQIHENNKYSQIKQLFLSENLCLFQPYDSVVALHPDYIYSYAPGIVQTSFPSVAKVKFYDGKVSKISRQEIYKISQQKYTEAVKLINDCAQELAGCDAIVLERKEGRYKYSMYNYIYFQIYK